MKGAVGVLIPAAGSGSRFGGTRPKQFLPLQSLPILAYSVRFFSQQPGILQIVVAVPQLQNEQVPWWVRRLGLLGKRVCWVPGGDSRQMSVCNAFAHLSPHCEWVAVHDAARPLVDSRLFQSILREARKVGAAVPGLPLTDTLKRLGGSSLIAETISREDLVAVQTPQIFRRSILETALQQARSDGYVGTDEASLVERLGVPVAVVPGSRRNVKITVATDLIWAEWLLAHPRWR